MAGKSGKGDHGGEDHSSDGGDDNKEIVTTSGLVVEKTSGTKGGTSKASVAVYHGVDGAPLSKSVVADITQFQVSWPLLNFLQISVNTFQVFFSLLRPRKGRGRSTFGGCTTTVA